MCAKVHLISEIRHYQKSTSDSKNTSVRTLQFVQT